MKLLKSLCSLLLVSLLAACGGGGGGGGTPIVGPPPTPAVADLVVVLSSATITNTGQDTVTARVTAVDANRNAVANVPTTISANNNGVVTASAAATDANGLVTATVGIGSDRTARTITVTATAGAITRTAQLTVGASSVVPSDLVLVLSAPSILNSGAEAVVATATALDRNRNAIAGVPVTFVVDSNGIATTTRTTTDASGRITAAVTIGADRAVRTMTVTARTDGLPSVSQALSVVQGPQAPTASDLVLVLSAPTIANNGADTVTATAVALDAKRNTLAGVPVTISVNAGAVATGAADRTDSAGNVRATIGVGADRSNRRIIVTATSGTLTQTAALDVVNATQAVPVAADLSLVLNSPSLPNGGTSTLTATATAVDANRNVVAGIPITFKVDSSAQALVSSATTNATGVVTAAIGIGADRSNRVVTVTATSGSFTRTASFRVIGAELGATFAPQVTVGSTNNAIEYKLVDTNAAPMVGQEIRVSGPGLPLTTGITDLAGKFVYTYNAPSTTGQLSLTATAAGDTEITTIVLQAAGGGAVDPAPGLPTGASVAADPSVVSVNTVGSNTNQTALRALFIGPNNAPIPRIRARFDLDGGSSSTDGTVSWLGGSYAYSDINGVARGTFTPGQRTSPTNGVTIRVCYDTIDFPIGTCPNATRATLTVVNEALSVAIGTSETVDRPENGQTYIQNFVVMVVDAAGQAKADVLITPSVDLISYTKGTWTLVGQNEWLRVNTLRPTEDYRWTGSAWELTGRTLTEGSCPNEDVNRNAVREAPAYDRSALSPALANRGEDMRWNGELDPRKAFVAVKMVGSARTDANGLALVQIEYPRDVAGWIRYALLVTATGVGGSESRAIRESNLLPYVRSSGIVGFGGTLVRVSPFGTGDVCTDTQ